MMVLEHLMVTNSTFADNTGNGSPGGTIAQIGSGSTVLTNITLSTNDARSAIFIFTGTLTLQNSIVVNNGGDSCEGLTTNGGNNIDNGTTCGWNSTNGSMSNTAPLLGSLANNGGLTQTMALLAGSPAINGVTYNSPNSAPATDQRGVVRPQGAGYDIGAYEYQADPPTAVPTMTEWGLMIFMFIAGLGSIYYLKRQRRTES